MLRRQIDCRHPLFLTADCGSDVPDAEKEIETLFGEDAPKYRSVYLRLRSAWAAYPDWIRPYLVYQISIFPYRPKEGQLVFIDDLLTAADRMNIHCVWQVAGWNSNYNEETMGNCASCEQVEAMLKKHPSFLGVDIVEQSCMDGLVPARRTYICDMLRLCAKYGAYVFWKDMGYPLTAHPMTIMGTDKEMLDTVRRYADNLVLINKRNGMAKHLQASGCALAYWLTGLCHAWGINSESWMQYESGHVGLFEPVKTWRLLHYAPEQSRAQIQTVFTAPETSFAQQILPDLAMGACVFSEETFGQIVSSEPTPIFRDVLGPLFEKAVNSDIIPDRETVRRKIRAAYRVSDLDAPEISMWGYGLYRGLCWTDSPDSYYEEHECSVEWLPRCGRYATIPLLPALISDEELSRLGPDVDVLDAASYAAAFPTEEDKRAWFDERYPEEFAGDAWGISVGDWWYFMHPEENTDDVKHFSLKTKRRGIEISGDLYHHTVGYIHEGEERDELWFSNLCSDSSSIWDGTFGDFNTFNSGAYLRKMMYDPDLSRKDPTCLSFRGVSDVFVEGDCTVKKEQNGDVLTLTLTGNGTVRLTF